MASDRDNVQRWSKKAHGGRLDCEVVYDSAGRMVKYMFSFQHARWFPHELIRFDHDPAGHEPRHMHLKCASGLMDEDGATVLRLLPRVLDGFEEMRRAVG